MNFWNWCGDVAVGIGRFAEKLESEKFVLGVLLIMVSLIVWRMLLKASADKARNFNLTDALIDPKTGKVTGDLIIQMAYAFGGLWVVILLAIAGTLAPWLLVAVLIIACGLPIARLAIEGILHYFLKKVGWEPPDPKLPDPAATTIKTETTTTVQQPGAGQ